MRTNRIELEGSHGRVVIEHKRGWTAIRIDSITTNPPKGEQIWETWLVESNIVTDDLYAIAKQVQRRCDGVVGTNGDVDGYYRELQRFQD
ncbi:MAG: hypothetical protein L0Z07_10425 [Planctomycetes bacterium]|nr:hypothetical protein [Planctomycetota bacterium]